MDSHHHRDVIEQVLCGALRPDDPGFLRSIERDPALRGRWERLRALSSKLDTMGAAQREPGVAMPEAEERVARLVRLHFEPGAGHAPPPRLLWATLLAAGLALTLWLITDTDPAATPSGLETLVLGEGDAVVSGMSALDLGGGSYRLDWADAQQSVGRTYLVRIHQRDGGVLGATLGALGSRELLSPPWTFSVPAGYDAEQLAWSVEVRDADRNPVATSPVRAFPSP